MSKMKRAQYLFSLKKVCLQIFLISMFWGISYSGVAQPKVGEALPGWTEGSLDIHHINTGKGEASFFILPDGTTMLVDAGATNRPKPRVTDAKPDDSRTPGEWISRYVLHFLLDAPREKLDYIFLTHFHDDHMGTRSSEKKSLVGGDYSLTGITEVGENVPFGKIIDRAWPEYNWPSPHAAEYIENYIRFVKWQEANEGISAEQFRVGRNDQFVLVNQPAKYSNFEIRNIAANGHVWTGVGNNARNHFPPLESLEPSEYPGENKLSCAFRLSYGAFDYFNGGDITTGAAGSWQDIETPVGLVTGPVDVCVANHHAYYDAMGVPFLQAVRPRIHIIQSWAPSHPSPSVIARMMSTWTYPGPRDAFSTNIMESTHTVIGSRIDDMKSRQGHIVIRVAPGGNSYMIYILDDSAESFRVTGIHGPYSSN
jgi:beta-lactamase superfamily II metal-dependent hydrolase